MSTTYLTHLAQKTGSLTHSGSNDKPPVSTGICEEIWKDVVGYEGRYAVSNLGRIKSLARKGNPTDKIVTGSKDSRGYPHIQLFKHGKMMCYKIHRLVAHAFISNPENKRTINHKNGIKTDNRVENLEWATDVENIRHCYATGLKVNPSGEKHSTAKLTQRQVDEIRAKYIPRKYSLSMLGKEYGVGYTTIYAVIRRQNWK